jgi:hypothetical protein
MRGPAPHLEGIRPSEEVTFENCEKQGRSKRAGTHAAITWMNRDSRIKKREGKPIMYLQPVVYMGDNTSSFLPTAAGYLHAAPDG